MFEKKTVLDYYEMLTILTGTILVLVIACMIAYFTPPYFNTTNHSACDFHLYSNLIPSIRGFQTRRIEQSESFCLPSPTGRRTQVHLSTIIVQPVANQNSPEINFQNFFENHSTWIEERLREVNRFNSRNRFHTSIMWECLPSLSLLFFIS